MLGALALLLLAQMGPPAEPPSETELEARQALKDGKRLEALELFEAAIREAEQTATKARLREQYLEAGWAVPRPANLAEERTIAGHIAAERLRLYGKAAERFANADKLHAAIMMRRVILEMLDPKSDRAKREHDSIKSMIRKLTENPSAEDKDLVAQILRAKREAPLILKAGRKLLAQGRYRVVVRLCQEMMYGEFKQEFQNEAIALRHEAERKASVDIPVDDRQAVREVMDDPRFDRIEIVRSRHFLYVGPAAFVRSIPERERLMLDLAYIFQSDLAVQHLTSNGVRIVLYYQETFSFGGGLAGGKLIRIGDRAIRLPIAGMLHYHELGHCIFGRGWLHHGFTEGLADFAAGFTLDALGQTQGAQQFIINARDQFVRYFLGREVRYFDIQSYRPSAGFLFSFLPPGEAPFDWAPYRRAFHRMREAQFGSWPEREHQIMRYFGYLMATEYGPETFDTLEEWGWPVSRRDWTLVPPEAADLLSLAKQGDYHRMKQSWGEAEDRYRAILSAEPDGPLAPRARFGLLHVAQARGDATAVARLKGELGILDDFKVLGAFHARRQNRYVVFPPETGRIDHEKQLRFRHETGIWKQAKVRFDGYVDLRKQGYGYPAHACAFALTYVHSDALRPARIWLGSDDGHAVYVNGRLAEKRAVQRVFRFDDDFCDIVLRPGWNRILIKVHNTNGAWGFLARLTGRDGRALGLRRSSKDLEARLPPDREPKRKPIPILNDTFKSLSKSRWVATVGSFDTQNGRLRPLGTAQVGLWMRFLVDPDKPKDGPANILWLRSPELAQAADFELELEVAPTGKNGPPAKFGFTIDGENENDGQSGHTFVFDKGRDKELRCHWYRYDHLLFLQQGVEVKPAELYRVTLRRVGTKWWLHVNGVPLFDRVDSRPLPAAGLGLLSWGKGPQFESVKFSRLAEK